MRCRLHAQAHAVERADPLLSRRRASGPELKRHRPASCPPVVRLRPRLQLPRAAPFRPSRRARRRRALVFFGRPRAQDCSCVVRRRRRVASTVDPGEGPAGHAGGRGRRGGQLGRRLRGGHHAVEARACVSAVSAALELLAQADHLRRFSLPAKAPPPEDVQPGSDPVEPHHPEVDAVDHWNSQTIMPSRSSSGQSFAALATPTSSLGAPQGDDNWSDMSAADGDAFQRKVAQVSLGSVLSRSFTRDRSAHSATCSRNS